MSDEIIKKLIEYLEAGGAFVKEQAPDVINQLLVYGAWDAQFGMWFSAAFVLFGLAMVLVNGISQHEVWEMLGPLIGIITFVVAMCAFGCDYSTLKKIELAPKVYLLEQLKKSAK